MDQVVQATRPRNMRAHLSMRLAAGALPAAAPEDWPGKAPPGAGADVGNGIGPGTAPGAPPVADTGPGASSVSAGNASAPAPPTVGYQQSSRIQVPTITAHEASGVGGGSGNDSTESFQQQGVLLSAAGSGG